MGNSIGRKKMAKVMKISGETIKLKTPIRAWDVVKDYPGHVLLEAETVKQYGIRAKPLELQQGLKPGKIYFLVELPKFPEDKAPRRVRSGGIHMSAKDRLECLMLSRRSVSDMSMVRASSADGVGPSGSGELMTVKMRLPRSQVAKLVEESRDGVEVAEKILDLYIGKGGGDADDQIHHEAAPWKPGLGSIGENCKAKREKRVSYTPQAEVELVLSNPS